MISLRRHLDNWDEQANRSRAAMQGYIRLLKELQTAGGELSGGEGLQFREDITAILANLGLQADPALIEKSGDDSKAAIQALIEVLNRREGEYKQIILIMAEAGATMARTGAAQGDELRQIATKVEHISRLDSILEVRQELKQHLKDLREMATRVQEQGETQSKKLQQQLEETRRTLKSVATLAETDPLTGVGNRRRAEAALKKAVADDAPLSVLMIDLNGFKAVNDNYGHAQGDSLLKMIARHLTHCLRESDLVCRWGGDEFIVVMPQTVLAEAEKTVERIRRDAFGEYVLARAGEHVQVNISASFGVAEWQRQETAGHLLERADKLMYQEKTRAKTGAARAARGTA